jgi:Tfp pilus assembly protein PilF
MKKSIMLIIALAAAGTSFGSDSEYTPPVRSQPAAKPDLYEQGMAAVSLGNYVEAEKNFTAALKADPKNPDILNMLAYTNRKLGKLDTAFLLYKKALALRPRFPQAREYLGEAHIQAVLQQIEILKTYGSEGKDDLDELLNALKQAAEDIK